jgi:trans-aconitate methyltransferase
MGAPFYPSSSLVIQKMLTLAGANSDSVVYDLGCGDGSILVSAAKDFHAKKVVGIEQNPKLYRVALMKTAGLRGVQVIFANYDDVNLSEASVVTLYQSASENARLKRKFSDELSSGTIIVSHDFGIPGWRPKEFHALREGRQGYRIIVYLMGFHTP